MDPNPKRNPNETVCAPTRLHKLRLGTIEPVAFERDQIEGHPLPLYAVGGRHPRQVVVNPLPHRRIRLTRLEQILLADLTAHRQPAHHARAQVPRQTRQIAFGRVAGPNLAVALEKVLAQTVTVELVLAEERERVEGVRPIKAHLGVHFLLLADVLAKGCHLLGAKLQDGFPERADCCEVGALELDGAIVVRKEVGLDY